MKRSDTSKKPLKRSDIPYQPLFQLGLFSDASREAATDALTQLCVVAKMFREREGLFEALKHWRDTHTHTDETVLPGLIVAEQAMSPSEKPLVDLWADCWKEVKPDHVRQILSGLVEDQCEPNIWVGDLMEAGYVDSGPSTFYRIMSENIGLNELGTIGLMGSSSAPAINMFLGKCLSIRVDTREEELLYKRLAFISDTNCHVEYASDETRFDYLPCDGYMCIPPLEEDEILIPVEINQKLPKELAGTKLPAESIAVLLCILDPMKRPASIVVSSRFLFKNTYASLRQYLVESGRLHSVIEMHHDFGDDTCAILALNHPVSKCDVVRLIDGPMFLHSDKGRRKRMFDWNSFSSAIAGIEHTAAANVTVERLSENDFELKPRRYAGNLLSELIDGHHVQPLSEVADIILSRSVAKKLGDNESISEPDFHEANLADIDNDGQVRKGSRPIVLKDKVKVEKLAHRLQKGDIIVGVKGSIGKAGLVTKEIPVDTLCGQSLAVIRLKPDSSIHSAEFLYRYLVQPLVTDYLESVSGGAFISFLRSKDLAELPVLVLPNKDQKRISKQHAKIIDMIHMANTLREQSQLLSNQLFSEKSV